MRQQAFREELVGFVHNQLIKEGTLEHYVVLMGTQYMLQVKYKKGSMIKFDVGGHTLLLYEVPYIDVPTLPEASKVSAKEVEGLVTEVQVEEKQCVIDDAYFDYMKPHVVKAVKEAAQWYLKADTKDPRRDNLSGVILSRFSELCESYSWHIICGEVGSENSTHLEPVTCHQVRSQAPQKFAKPTTAIRLGFFLRLRAKFQVQEGKRTTTKAFDVVVFNQKHNPQTSVGSMITKIKREGIQLSSLFSTKGLAIVGFLLMFFVFLLNSRLCSGYESPDPLLGDGTVMMMMGEDQIGVLEKVCRLKKGVVTNLVVAFLVITVIRQVMIRMPRR